MYYTYNSSISRNEIRLLKPVSISRHSLAFSTLIIHRAAAPAYTAVSYTWGDGEASEVILLDGRPFNVRVNLWSCLYYVGQAARSAAWRYMWVDAICINQANIAEKNAQVGSMDEIYRKATCVSVWLGLVPMPDMFSPLPPEVLPIKTLEIEDFDWFGDIKDLANRPYWYRSWVVQEFLLGQDVELYCSNTRMKWDDFQGLLCRVAGVEQFGDVFSTSSIPSASKTREYRALPLIMARHPDKHPGILQTFSDLIIDHQGTMCKDPRDRIFSLLGLLKNDERAALARFFPDYTMPMVHVLVIALAHLNQMSCLENSRYNTGRITPRSDRVFRGLGVESRAQRKQLLRWAERIDYSDRDVTGAWISQVLAFHDQLDEYQGEDPEDEGDTRAARPLSSRARQAFVWFGLLVVTAGGAIFFLGQRLKAW